MGEEDDQSGGVICYVSKIDVKGNAIEICDAQYSLRCKFASSASLDTLREFIKGQPEDINILGLLGKQLKLHDAAIRYSIKS